ncbi:MAG: hypothetical protein HQM05_18225, partial [Magnetococcales bacterium]|nr:hypothetical protein [Magnetococcales bacterium]
KVYNTTLDLGGDLSVQAAQSATISASTSNATTAAAGSAAASVVLASNAMSTAVDAYVRFPDGTLDKDKVICVAGDLLVSANDAPNILSGVTVSAIASAPEEGDGEYFTVDLRSGDGLQEVRFGDQVLVADDHEAGGEGGRIYRYMGGETVELDLSETDFSDTGYWYELVPLPPSLDMVNKFMGLLGTEMPYLEKEFTLASIPIGDQSFDIGLKVSAGWQDLTVKEFLKGEAEAAEGGLEILPTGIKLSLPASVMGKIDDVLSLIPFAGESFASPVITIELVLPDPELPYFEYEKILGALEYGGQEYEWGVKAEFGWPNTTLLDIVNLQALLSGDGFSPILPELDTNLFLRPVQVASAPAEAACGAARRGETEAVPVIDAVDFLPSQFIFAAPTATFNFLGKSIQLQFARVTMDTPAEFSRYVDSSLDPMAVDLGGLEFGDSVGGTPVVIDLPALTAPGADVSAQLITQFKQLLRFIPSEIQLQDPAISASVLGHAFTLELPVASIFAALGESLPSFIVPGDGYTSLNIADLFPESAAEVLDFFLLGKDAAPLVVDSFTFDLGSFGLSGVEAASQTTDTATDGADSGTTDQAEADFVGRLAKKVETGTAGQSAIQRLLLNQSDASIDYGADEPPSFVLKMADPASGEEFTTAAIEVLQLDVAFNETQRLIFLQKPVTGGGESDGIAFMLKYVPAVAEGTASDSTEATALATEHSAQLLFTGDGAS